MTAFNVMCMALVLINVENVLELAGNDSLSSIRLVAG